MKNKVVSILFSLLIIVLGGCGCPYTEESVAVPDFLKTATLVLEKDAYVAKGIDLESCSRGSSRVRVLKDIAYQIVDSAAISNGTIGKKYYEQQGLTVDPLKSGKKFTIEQIIAQTKHGITTIDSGPGPIFYFILRDERGALYKVATVSLGMNRGEPYLAYYNNGKRVGFLDVNISKHLVNNEK